jgi:outer membrane protein assembly factor BamB
MRKFFQLSRLLATLAGIQAAEAWPEFRGPTGQGLSTATNVPLRWSVTENVAWKAPVPGKGWSSPVLSSGKVYLTSAVEENQQVSLRALCYNAKNGEPIWNVEVIRPDGEATKALHKKNSLASPTPILADDRFYVHFGHLGTACLDLQGNVLWTNTELKYPPVHGNGGSPALVKNLLVFNCDAATDPFVAALDAQRGTVQWKMPRRTPAARKFSFSTPLLIEVEGEQQIISPGSGMVAAYQPATGSEIWRVRYDTGYSVIPRPVFANGLLYISSGFDRPVLYAIDPKGAKGDATEKNVLWKHSRGAPNTPSMIAVDDNFFFVSDAGIASCLDARSGTVHWSERLGGEFSASPVSAEARLYFQSEAGVGYVVKAGKTFELLARNDLGERTFASPALADNAVFLRSESHLWRVGK